MMKKATCAATIMLVTLLGAAAHARDAVIAPGELNSAPDVSTNRAATWQCNVALLALSERNGQEGPADTPEYSGGGSAWNWHKIFGYSTIVTGLATIVTGFVAPDAVHWGFAGVSSALGVVTCANGYYQYHSVLGFSNGSARYTAHAILGTVATAGFIASMAMADHEGKRRHVVVGAASGIAFTVAIGVCYF